MEPISFRKFLNNHRSEPHIQNNQAKVISVASGKGGVGKTFFSTSLAKFLVSKRNKVLVIDCDVFLSNCYLSLGVTPQKDIFDLMAGEPIENCITNIYGIDLISGRSGNELDSSENYVETIIRITQSLESKYDFIILDCPAGIERKMLSLMAYSDERIIVLNPNKFSLTDSYSLIKTLKLKFGVNNYSILLNKCDSKIDEDNISNSLLRTCNTFLPDIYIKKLGRINNYNLPTQLNGEIISTDLIWSNVYEYLNDNVSSEILVQPKNHEEMEFRTAF